MKKLLFLPILILFFLPACKKETSCPAFYESSAGNCNEIRAKYLGEWVGYTTKNNLPYQNNTVIQLISIPNEVDQISWNPFTLRVTESNTGLIDPQTNGSTGIVGSFSVTNNQLSISYTLTSGSSSDQYLFIGTR